MSYNEITLPSQFAVIEENDTRGIFEVRGLFPGYGHTFGNALRRVIFSSLPGVAPVSIKIENVDHEFTTLDGMKEDVLRLTLNLQQVRARLIGVTEAVAHINITGPAVVTAGDIGGNSAVEIANPEFVLCELTGKTKFAAEISFNTSIGYVPKTVHHHDRVPVGIIALDAVYTPVRKVSYEVENMRVGDRTDYNRLVITVETDGTLTPRNAFESAVHIMIAQMRSILNLADEEFSAPVAASQVISEVGENQALAHTAESVPGSDDVLKTRVDSLELSSRTLNALSEANIRTVGGLVRKSAQDILDIEGIGPKGLDEIRSVLGAFDLTLKD